MTSIQGNGNSSFMGLTPMNVESENKQNHAVANQATPSLSATSSESTESPKVKLNNLYIQMAAWTLALQKMKNDDGSGAITNLKAKITKTTKQLDAIKRFICKFQVDIEEDNKLLEENDEQIDTLSEEHEQASKEAEQAIQAQDAVKAQRFVEDCTVISNKLTALDQQQIILIKRIKENSDDMEKLSERGFALHQENQTYKSRLTFAIAFRTQAKQSIQSLNEQIRKLSATV